MQKSGYVDNFLLWMNSIDYEELGTFENVYTTSNFTEGAKYHSRILAYIPEGAVEVTIVAENSAGASAETVRIFKGNSTCNGGYLY